MTDALRSRSSTGDLARAAVASGIDAVAVLEAMDDGLFVLDRDWHFTYLNPRAAALLSGGQGLAGTSIWAVPREIVGGEFERCLRRAMAEGVPARGEQFYEPMGIWLEASANPFAGGLIVCLRDTTARRDHEAALEENEGRFRQLADSAPVLVWMSGPDKGGIYFNKTWLDFTGRPLGRQLGAGWLESVHPDDLPALEACAEAFAARRPFRTEFRLRRRDGEWRWMLDTGVPHFAPDGRFLGYIGSCIDISERRAAEDDIRHAEEALRQSEERFRLAQEAAAVGTYDWEVQAGVIRWSSEMIRLHGIDPGTPPERLYEAWLERLHPEDRDWADRETRAFLEREGPLDIEFRVLLPDGTVRWIHGRGTMVRDPDGRPLRMIGVNMDVTERHLAEEALRASETRYRTLFEQAAVGVVHASLDGRWLLVNQTCAEILGYAPDELVGRHFTELTHPDDVASDLAQLAALDSGVISAISREKRFLRQDGSPVWVYATASVVHGSSGAPSHRIAVVQDITERKRAEERQRLLIHELNHRVKNTLATVQSLAAQTLRSAPSPEAFRAAFEARLVALSRAHDLLTRSNWTGAELRDVLAQALAPYREGEAALARVELRGAAVRLPPRPALTLGMTFHELATNAAKYGALSTSGGRVEVSWRADAGDGIAKVRIDWREAGGPRVERPARPGFGMRLIERSIENDLDGAVRLDFDPAGVHCAIEIPLDSDPHPGGAR